MKKIFLILMLYSLSTLACGDDSSPEPPGTPHNAIWLMGGQSNMANTHLFSNINVTVLDYLLGWRKYYNGEFPEIPVRFSQEMKTLGKSVSIAPTAIPATSLNCWMSGHACFNRTIAPLQGNTIKGIVFWQGEHDAADCTGVLASTYGQRLTSMIEGWRTFFGRQIPFIIVQLENDNVNFCGNGDTYFNMISDAQASVANSVPLVSLVTIKDITYGEHHPIYAYPEIAKRIAAAALATY